MSVVVIHPFSVGQERALERPQHQQVLEAKAPAGDLTGAALPEHPQRQQQHEEQSRRNGGED